MQVRKWKWTLVLIPLLILTTFPTSQKTFEAQADSSIMQGTDPFHGTTLDNRNFGWRPDLFLGKLRYGGKVYGRGRIVLKFDRVSCALLKAELVLVAKSGWDVMIRAYPLKSEFDEGQVTWNQARTGQPWSGGDYDTSEQLDHKYFSFLSSGQEMRLDVTSWAKSGGEYLILDSGGSDGNATFYSRESGRPPRLEVVCLTFTPPTISPTTPSSTSTSTSSSSFLPTSSPGTNTSNTTTSSAISSTNTVTLQVKVRPTYVQVKRGGQVNLTVSVEGNVPKARVGVGKVPEDVIYTLAKPSGTPPFQSDLFLDIGEKARSFDLTVFALARGIKSSAKVHVEVVEEERPYFTVFITPGMVECSSGEKATFKVEVRGHSGFREEVELKVRAPKGFEVSLERDRGRPPFSVKLEVEVPNGARPGSVMIRVIGVSGGLRVSDYSTISIVGGKTWAETESETEIRTKTTEVKSSSTKSTGVKPPVKPTRTPEEKEQPQERVDLLPYALVAVALMILVVGIYLYRRS